MELGWRLMGRRDSVACSERHRTSGRVSPTLTPRPPGSLSIASSNPTSTQQHPPPNQTINHARPHPPRPTQNRLRAVARIPTRQF
ncbi:uncharacterized protein BO80DRAFT_56659 [Aspergillus ibericus CBS 121593]|uniref:Uncharacterized protein n=1 Tax=Aspergillus ibericus CBS 121593 TaxID=1448316 RepID=A0A395H2X4_9EURO|nr:hypothetical protein BO80DRAFT_56659 [Aspergillus ibericus CBS 121593]RAL01759.1 hypothetical protein BO80DRAFT_56659 [Aspergillus ibericus CBS 121593]